MRYLLLTALLALCVFGPARAHDGKHGGFAGAEGSALGHRWDFSLPTLDGSRFVQAQALRGPVLVNFWGRDCPPCIAELPRLEAFAKANPQWTVWLVSTDAPAVAAEFVRRIDLKAQVLRPGSNVVALMRRAGNRHGALPFSVGLREGRICRTQLGEIHESDLTHWTADCETPLTYRRSPS